MLESIIAYLIITFAIVVSLIYIIKTIISIFEKKKNLCSYCEIKDVCKKRKIF